MKVELQCGQNKEHDISRTSAVNHGGVRFNSACYFKIDTLMVLKLLILYFVVTEHTSGNVEFSC